MVPVIICELLEMLHGPTVLSLSPAPLVLLKGLRLPQLLPSPCSLLSGQPWSTAGLAPVQGWGTQSFPAC